MALHSEAKAEICLSCMLSHENSEIMLIIIIMFNFVVDYQVVLITTPFRPIFAVSNSSLLFFVCVGYNAGIPPPNVCTCHVFDFGIVSYYTAHSLSDLHIHKDLQYSSAESLKQAIEGLSHNTTIANSSSLYYAEDTHSTCCPFI